MTQDFANSSRSKSKEQTTASKKKPRRNTRRKPAKKTTTPAWTLIIMVFFFCTTAALAGYLYLQDQNKSTNPKKPEANSANTEKKSNVTPQPRLDFYRILKEQEVEVADRSDEITASPNNNIVYFLQAGSFRNPSDADKLRAQLLLLNLETNIETTTTLGATWHRVLIGPIESHSKMAKVRSDLISNGIRPLVLKRKP